MLTLSIPIWELVVRALAVYLFLLLLLRLSGKRQVGQLAPFDFVLLLILSNAVQNSMNGGDNSLLGGLISACTLVALNHGVGVLTFKSKKAEALVDGQPEVLVRNGKVNDAALARAQITANELRAALRREGCESVAEVRLALLEVNGGISVMKIDGTG